MRVVGKRKEAELATQPSGELLARACAFMESMRGLGRATTTGVPRGVYRFATHAAADAHRMECTADNMARASREFGHDY